MLNIVIELFLVGSAGMLIFTLWYIAYPERSHEVNIDKIIDKSKNMRRDKPIIAKAKNGIRHRRIK